MLKQGRVLQAFTHAQSHQCLQTDTAILLLRAQPSRELARLLVTPSGDQNEAKLRLGVVVRVLVLEAGMAGVGAQLLEEVLHHPNGK